MDRLLINVDDSPKEKSAVCFAFLIWYFFWGGGGWGGGGGGVYNARSAVCFVFLIRILSGGGYTMKDLLLIL